MPGGRPTKRTPEAWDQIIEALRAGCPREVSAAAGGMTYQTFREWEKADAEFSEAVERAEGFAQEQLLGRIRSASQEGMVITRKDGEVVAYPGAWQAAAWLLERRWPQRYAVRTKTEVSGPDGGPIQYQTPYRDDHEAALLKQAIDREISARRDADRPAPATEAEPAVESPAEGVATPA